MAHSQTPRSLIKALARGQVPPQPLFIPLAFALAAKLEETPLPAFLTHPTKLANALAALHRHLRTDGVVGYFDLTLEAEALGCRLDWSAGLPVIAAPPPDPLPYSLPLHAAELLQQGRLGVALEVVRRLRVTLRDEPALLVALTGPIRLGQQLSGAEFGERLAGGEGEATFMLDELAGLTLRLAQAFCQAGADIILVEETVVPPTALNLWQMVMEAVWNVTRFHEALPAVHLAGSSPALALDGTPLICLDLAASPEATTPAQPFGLALPAGSDPALDLKPWLASGHCALVTTADQIPYPTPLPDLEGFVKAMQTALKRGTGGVTAQRL